VTSTTATQPSLEIPVPSTEEVVQAHKLYQEREPRWRDYWRAVEGVEDGFVADNLANAALAIATLLKSWHKEYFHWNPRTEGALRAEIQQLIAENLQTIQMFRARSLATLSKNDRGSVLKLFASFQRTLRPVGAAKSLNLLAPQFFPLWDNSISYGYGVITEPHGYFLYMLLVKDQIARIDFPDGLDPLKTLDEYNYCKYTKMWLP